MKLFITLLLGILSGSTMQAQTNALLTSDQNNNTLLKTGHPAVKQLRSDNWYMMARQKIREQEYHIKWKTGLQEYVSVNRKNQVGFYFGPEGYRVIPFAASRQGWEAGFHLTAIRWGTVELQPSDPVKISQQDNRLVYQYPHYAIEYLNDTNGMRQNFIIDKRPGGKGALEIVISLQGDLQTSVTGNNRLNLSSNRNGTLKTVLSYDQLKVWDDNGKSLEAKMELRDGGKTLVLSVDDANAAYPVTVDPLNHTADWTDNGLGVLPSLDVLYGSTVSDAGDINNDGYDDIIIGAPSNIDVLSNSVIASTGQAFIYLGSSSGLSSSPDITLQSSAAINALFGFSVSSAGDINGDGYDDVIVGAPGDQVTLNFGIPFGSLTNNIGKTYIFYGNATPAAVPGSVVSINLRATDFLGATFGLTINPLYGYSVSSAGDVNNDGYADVIVGSPAYTDLGTLTLAGRATVYLGSAGGLNTASPIHRSAGLLSNTLFGFSVSSAGDMNNDGADEVVIGAPGALSLLPGIAGKVYVYSGVPLPATGGIAATAVTYSDGALLKTLFGFSVSNAGDVNNDGYDDIVVGQPGTLSGLVAIGKASIFFGESSLSAKTTDDVSLISPRDPTILGLLSGNLLFGFSVSGGKDLDCDGIADVVIGEPGGSGLSGLTGINAAGGQAYIYHGRNGTGPAGIAGWHLEETGSLVAANLLGYSVSIAGDVNGDGKNEIIVGAANGTLNISNILGGVVNFLFVQSVGSAYVYNGCLAAIYNVLPIELLSFNGYRQNNTVALKWQTSSEQNADHFDVERSVNGLSFEKIGVVIAKGESSTTTNYQFIDNRPVPGNNSYRLKLTDKDGAFTYSSIVTVKMEGGNFVRMRSNMVSTALTLEFNNTSQGDYSIDLLSMDGRIVQHNMISISAGFSIHSLSLQRSFPKGMYIVRILNAKTAEQYEERFITR